MASWTVRTISGAAGGFCREASVNLNITCEADTVEEVRRLASAAPDLLDALETCIPALIRLGDFIGNQDNILPRSTGINLCEIIDKVTSAISKARPSLEVK